MHLLLAIYPINGNLDGRNKSFKGRRCLCLVSSSGFNFHHLSSVCHAHKKRQLTSTYLIIRDNTPVNTAVLGAAAAPKYRQLQHSSEDSSKQAAISHGDLLLNIFSSRVIIHYVGEHSVIL